MRSAGEKDQPNLVVLVDLFAISSAIWFKQYGNQFQSAIAGIGLAITAR